MYSRYACLVQTLERAEAWKQTCFQFPQDRFKYLLKQTARVTTQQSSQEYEWASLSFIERLDKFKHTLDSANGGEFSYQQKKALRNFMRPCIHHIVGSKVFASQRADFAVDVGWEVFPSAAVLVCPRRFGKTIAATVFVAAMLLWAPDNLNITVYSVSMNSATEFRLQVEQFFHEMAAIELGDAEGARHACISNKGQFTVINAHHRVPTPAQAEALRKQGKCNSLTVMCGGVASNGARGVRQGLIVLDEASFINSETLMKSVAPATSQAGVTLLAVSSPLSLRNSRGFFNLFVRFVQVALSDPRLRKQVCVMLVSLYCDECRAAGIPASKCKHNLHKLPPWVSVSQSAVSKALMGGDEKSIQQELYGVLDGEQKQTGLVFSPADVESLFTGRPQIPEFTLAEPDAPTFALINGSARSAEQIEWDDLRTANTFIDPSGAGKCSAHVMVTVVFCPRLQKHVIVGMGRISAYHLCDQYKGNAGETRPDEFQTETHTVTYFKELLAQPALRNHRHRVFIESNMSDALIQLISRSVRAAAGRRSDIFEFADQRRRMGVRTTITTKNRAVADFTRVMLPANKVVVAENVFCFVRPFVKNQCSPGQERNFLEHQLRSECKRFRRTKVSANGLSSFSGKGSEVGESDDLILAIIMLLYWTREAFYRAKRFAFQ